MPNDQNETIRIDATTVAHCNILDVVNQLNVNYDFGKGDSLLDALNIFIDGCGESKETSLERALSLFISCVANKLLTELTHNEPDEPDPSSVS